MGAKCLKSATIILHSNKYTDNETYLKLKKYSQHRKHIPKTKKMSKQVKIEKFDSETNPFSIENMIKKEDTSNDSGYSVSHSEESGSENGLEKPLVSFFVYANFKVS